MKKSTKCVFFSTQYPPETTLDKELILMSQEFEEVHYFPLYKKNNTRDDINLPNNIKVNFLLANNRDNWNQIFIKNNIEFITILFTEMFQQKQFKNYFLGWKTYISILARNINYANILEQYIKDNDLSKSVFYDYWFENATLALAILKKRNVIHSFSTRIHGFDLYDERWKEGKVPFRQTKMKYVKLVGAVSNFGKKYLQSKIDAKYEKKVICSFLGVDVKKDLSIVSLQREEKIIVSASNTQLFKRVHLIPDVLNLMSSRNKIRWIHFGVGPCDEILKEKLSYLNDNIKVELRGWVANKEILKEYEAIRPDLFISLSTSEGLPISMMESVALGIPVFAANICGIPDLVKNSTGRLFNVNNSIEEIALSLEDCLQIEFNPNEIRQFALSKFEYKKNYLEFYKLLLDDEKY